MKSFPWEKNEFYQDIRRRIETLWENVNTKDMFFDTRRQMWAQEGVPGKCSMTAFLQNQYLCWGYYRPRYRRNTHDRRFANLV